MPPPRNILVQECVLSSFIAQFRLRILPLEKETGRYTPIYAKYSKINRKRGQTRRSVWAL